MTLAPGWTLPTFPWFIDQTIAGAIATGSHGTATHVMLAAA
jgi:FAD/FMN-containing dehydrogenase